MTYCYFVGFLHRSAQREAPERDELVPLPHDLQLFPNLPEGSQPRTSYRENQAGARHRVEDSTGVVVSGIERRGTCQGLQLRTRLPCYRLLSGFFIFLRTLVRRIQSGVMRCRYHCTSWRERDSAGRRLS